MQFTTWKRLSDNGICHDAIHLRSFLVSPPKGTSYCSKSKCFIILLSLPLLRLSPLLWLQLHIILCTWSSSSLFKAGIPTPPLKWLQPLHPFPPNFLNYNCFFLRHAHLTFSPPIPISLFPSLLLAPLFMYSQVALRQQISPHAGIHFSNLYINPHRTIMCHLYHFGLPLT